MKKLVLVFLGLIPMLAFGQQRIYLKQCLRLGGAFFADQSGTMNSATKSLAQWARDMTLVPTEKGIAEVGLYSFESGYTEWCEPTGNKDTLIAAIDSFQNSLGDGGGTYPYVGLHAIRLMLSERKLKDSSEVQFILIHSDYHWSDYENAEVEIKELLADGVIVFLSLPKEYDGDNSEYYHIHEEKLASLQKLGCINIRSDFKLFVKAMEALKPPNPCQ